MLVFYPLGKKKNMIIFLFLPCGNSLESHGLDSSSAKCRGSFLGSFCYSLRLPITAIGGPFSLSLS